MILNYRILTLNAGMTTIGSGALLYSTVLEVDREGVGVDQIGVLAAWKPRSFKHQPSHGLILFNPDEPGSPGGEKVYVFYKKL